ncbi:LysR family transcriptional regulator [Yoonia sp. GPGPB17]|uniref:LysR family transcriptional regulator n=1 Tax=Yoonia sp. GPGPB17 TaxID=3026147 RepID=UPI0030BE025A
MIRTVAHQTLRRLAYFEAIAQAGSIRGAAQRLGLSVPVLSAALSELEDELNVTLAVRSTRSMELTNAGEQVYRDASRMIEAAQSALSHSDDEQVLTGTVGVTLPAELALHWLPKRMSTYSAIYPEVELAIDANDHMVDLDNSVFDIAIRTNYAPKRPSDSARDEALFGWLDLVVVAREVPDIRETESALEFAVDSTFMVGPGGSGSVAGYRDGLSSPITLHPYKLMMVANREAAIAFAKQGLGCVLVTELSVAEDLETGRLVRVCPEMTFGGIALRTVMRDNLPSPAARRLCDVLSEQAT